jgi:hypothetical protein
MFRQGHVSEAALVEALLTGDRPAHLDRCDLCAERAVELGRWLDDVRAAGLEAADAAFPPDRLAAQQSQILRRLEQLDEPARVIAFPSHYRHDARESARRRIAPAWVGVAAAAGVALGMVGGQLTARLSNPGPSVIPSPAEAPQIVPATQPAQPAATGLGPREGTLFDTDQDLDRTVLPSVEALDELTPRVVKIGTDARVR